MNYIVTRLFSTLKIKFSVLLLLLLIGAFLFFNGCNANTQGPYIVEQQFKQCLNCHSNSEMQRGPTLDGKESWYLLAQLKKFKAGIRGKNKTNKSEYLMGSVTKQLRGEKEMLAISNYISQLSKPRHLVTVKGDIERGEKISQNCFVCHGHQGEGNQNKNSPALVGLEDWYVIMQLRQFKSGQRGRHELDIDGQLMGQSLSNLTDKDFKDITAYLNKLTEKTF